MECQVLLSKRLYGEPFRLLRSNPIPIPPKAGSADQYLVPRKGLPVAFMRAHTKIFTTKVAKNHFIPLSRHKPWYSVLLGVAGTRPKYEASNVPTLSSCLTGTR